MFDAEARRHLQNTTGESTGADVDPIRADAEGVGLIDAVLSELGDPNRDGDDSDSFFDNHLLPMLGVPQRLIEFQQALGIFGEILDDTILGPLSLALNPLNQTLAELRQIPIEYIKDFLETQFGIPFDLLDQLSGLHNKMDLASITIGDRTIPVFKPTDHAKIDAYMGIQGGGQLDRHLPRPGTRVPVPPEPGRRARRQRRVQQGHVRRLRATRVVLAKVLLLHELPLGGFAASASNGGLSKLDQRPARRWPRAPTTGPCSTSSAATAATSSRPRCRCPARRSTRSASSGASSAPSSSSRTVRSTGGPA